MVRAGFDLMNKIGHQENVFDSINEFTKQWRNE